jgi:sterol desaturase/sphingolipid hydroxylase (fatty acid hydroxylase superfamily)
MLFNRNYIRRNLTLISIVIFIALYAVITYMKPGFLYNQDGSLRNFGLNSNKRTVVPAWLLAILLAILSYLFVMYYLAMPKLIY